MNAEVSPNSIHFSDLEGDSIVNHHIVIMLFAALQATFSLKRVSFLRLSQLIYELRAKQ